MKIVIENSPVSLALALRKIGYSFKRTDAETGEISATRALARGGFPRFHIYAKIGNGALNLNLHLDQKRPSYAGGKAHSGEHESDAVKKESQRIEKILC